MSVVNGKNTKKMVIAVYGNLYIGNIDTEKLHSQGGFLVTATNEEIQKAIKDIYWLDVRVIRQDVRYENILLGDDVQLCVYATGDIQVGSRMSMMSTRSASPSLDYPVFYALQGSILNAPLNPQEVYKLLGVGKYKGEWWDNTYICSGSHGRTNQWAKYKPEIINTPKDVTEDQRRNNMYGFSVPKISTSNLNTDAVWEYKPPVAGINWCRSTDFDGYDNNSEAPIAIFIPRMIYSDAPDINNVYIDMDGDFALAQNNVMVRDIFHNYLDWYPGVIVYHKTRKVAIWRTAEVTLERFDNGTEIQVPILPVWANGDDLEIYAMLSRYSYTGTPVDTPPLDHDAFYLQYEAGKGHVSATIGVRFPVQASVVVVGSPVITFSKQWYNGAYHWHIVEMRSTVKNNAAKTMNLYLHSYIEDENNGDIYYLENSSNFSLASNSQYTVYQDADLFIPATASEVFVEIVAVEIGGSSGGVIFTKYYNFETGTWRDV